MPIYQYQILNGKNPPEVIEIEENYDAPPSTLHPITKEPIKRISGDGYDRTAGESGPSSFQP